MKKFLLVAAFILLSVMASQRAEAQNCVNDWHPPPCGKPPEPVKNPLLNVLKQAARYHAEYGTQLWVLVAASSCGGSVGNPGIDSARQAACAMGGALGAINLATQGWQNRLIDQINGVLGGSREVVMMPSELASFDFDDPYLEALVDHRNTIEWLGGLINDSVQTTFDCDAWAQYDIRGIECGDNQRAWTVALLGWQGERYSAVSAIEDYLANQLDVDVIGQGVVDDIHYDAVVNGWEGWWMQQ
jgi:hypothetical protein